MHESANSASKTNAGTGSSAATGSASSRSSGSNMFSGAKSKVFLSFLQVSSVYNIVYDVQWPKGFENLLSYLAIVNINALTLPALNVGSFKLNLAVKCDEKTFGGTNNKVNFYDSFMFAFVVPLGITLLFILLGIIGAFKHSWLTKGGRHRTLFRREKVDERDKRRAKELGMEHVNRCYHLFFLMLLVVYPSVCRTTLQVLSCARVDDMLYLAADYTIDCKSPQYLYQYRILGWLCVVMYIIGIPLVMALALFGGQRNHKWADRSFILYAAYKQRYWWFEVYDLLRKLVLTGVIIFVR